MTLRPFPVFVVTIEISTHAPDELQAERLVLDQLAERQRLGGVLDYQALDVRPAAGKAAR